MSKRQPVDLEALGDLRTPWCIRVAATLKGIDLEDVPASPTIEIEAVLLGGRRRTLTQFRELARAAGLEVSGAGRQPSGHSVVECRPTTAT